MDIVRLERVIPPLRRARKQILLEIRARVYAHRVMAAIRTLPPELRTLVTEAILFQHDRQLAAIARERKELFRDELQIRADAVAAEMTRLLRSEGLIDGTSTVVWEAEEILRRSRL